MYNFAKLSEGSRLFVGKLQAGDAVDVAVAKAISNNLPLPTFPVDNPEAQFKDTCAVATNKLTSDISEITVIKFDHVVELVRMLWMARYYTLNPQEHILDKDGDPMACFMGFGKHIPPVVCKVVWNSGMDLITNINGFAQIIREIVDTDVVKNITAMNEISMLTPRVR